MPPPTAEPLATRVLLGPALRTQSDRRLVRLVRQGYETAFEEIVRRYRRQLDRFAAGIVGGRAEDVTQDALSKALLALRGSENEIELRPWLYRIVRNTALNDLRDRPPSAEELGETIPGGLSAAAEAERREEMADLVGRLQALPEPQRAAIVMRELEGLSHEEIAAALGVSGGAARQAIHRARTTLRDGLGLLIPLPLLRMLADHGAEAAAGGTAAAAAGAGAASAAAGGGGAALGGLGAGGALKVGLATALVAGTVGTGVVVKNSRDAGSGAQAAPAASSASSAEDSGTGSSGRSGSDDSPADDGGSGGPGPGRHGEAEPGDDRGGHGEAEAGDDRGGHGGGARGEDHGGSSGPGSSRSGHGGRGSGEDSGGSRHGSGGSGGGSSGRGGQGGGSSGDDGGHGGGSGSGGGGSHSGSGKGSPDLSEQSRSSGSGGSGSGPAPAIPPSEEDSSSDDSGSGGASGSGSGSGGGSDDS